MTTPPDALPSHAELVLPDYDHLPASALPSRIRTLDLDGLKSIVAYEESHAHRPFVLEVMNVRLEELRNGAEPSGGDPAALAPEAPAGTAGGSKVSGATTGPTQNPTSQGDPTNPGQPRGSGKGSTQSPVRGA